MTTLVDHLYKEEQSSDEVRKAREVARTGLSLWVWA